MTSILHLSEQAILDLPLDLSGTWIKAFPLLFFGGVSLVVGLILVGVLSLGAKRILGRFRKEWGQ